MKHWIHQWYENHVMATSWGRFGLAAFVSDVLYYILFSKTTGAQMLRLILLLVIIMASLMAAIYLLG